MVIILTKDDFFGYEFVLNYAGKPKEFANQREAWDYADEMEIYPFQIIEVSI
jgi:hypothetical protein